MSHDGRRYRIGIASIIQETNTWSPVGCTIEDFECQGLAVGQDVWDLFHTTNTEVGGAMRAVMESGSESIPLVRAWANSSGRLTRETLERLCELLKQELRRVRIDALVLALHGAMAADGEDDADAAVLSAARDVVGPQLPIGVCLDLHANVTRDLVRESDFVIGFHTYPHTDLAETGGRTARLLLDRLKGGVVPITALAKRPMLIPAETMSTESGPLAELRRKANRLKSDAVLDISIFPVQPWLDVEELGLGVTVTTNDNPGLGAELAETIASEAWNLREEFAVELVTPAAAIEAARNSRVRPFLISESADAPTAGAAGDSPAMVRALLKHGADLESFVTVTDPLGVGQCEAAGIGGRVELSIGSRIDPRFHPQVRFSGVVENLGSEPVLLTGPSYTGMEVSMGRFAVVRSEGISVLISERPAFTLDPATFAHAGLDPSHPDIIVVRSANGFKAAYSKASVEAAIFLDLPGASTPRLKSLDFNRAPRPIYPLDPEMELAVKI